MIPSTQLTACDYHRAKQPIKLTCVWLARLTAVLTICLATTGCLWTPKLYHSDVFTEGRSRPIGKFELGGQVLPGGAFRLGLGQGFEGQFRVAIEGEEIGALEGALARSFELSEYVSSKVSIGYEDLSSGSNGFSATRVFLGFTTSLYSDQSGVALHLPVKLYHLDYNWINFLDKTRSRTGVYLVTGAGLSLSGKHVGLGLGANFPSQSSLGEVELLTTLGIQIFYRN